MVSSPNFRSLKPIISHNYHYHSENNYHPFIAPHQHRAPGVVELPDVARILARSALGKTTEGMGG